MGPATAWQIALGALLMAGVWQLWTALWLIDFTVVASLLLLDF